MTTANITAKALADKIFTLITDENKHQFCGANADEHNRVAIESCAEFLNVYGDLFDIERHRWSAENIICGSLNLSKSREIPFADAIRIARPYEEQYGKAAFLDLNMKPW